MPSEVSNSVGLFSKIPLMQEGSYKLRNNFDFNILNHNILRKGGGPQSGHQALYISSHQPTLGRNVVL